MTVTCGWPRCDWGVQREAEGDCWSALYAHIKRAHGHDVTAERVAAQQDSGVKSVRIEATPEVASTTVGGLTTTQPLISPGGIVASPQVTPERA